jgi:hypothetical protein
LNKVEGANASTKTPKPQNPKTPKPLLDELILIR